MWLFFCLNAFMGAGDWIPPVPAFLFQRNHPHGGKALPRNRTAKNTAPLAYAIRLRGRVPADAALTVVDPTSTPRRRISELICAIYTPSRENAPDPYGSLEGAPADRGLVSHISVYSNSL